MPERPSAVSPKPVITGTNCDNRGSDIESGGDAVFLLIKMVQH